jgi:phosphoglycolate phosphatase-like HAD superfamily hydrolase
VVDALKELMRLDGVSKSRHIIFVCHSMGGIVARRFVVARASDLIATGTSIGFFLIASPSLGSDYASWLSPLASFFGHTQVDALRFEQTNSWLMDLDRDFRNIKESGYPLINGKELVEDKFIILKRLLRKQVVEPFSGARYFGEPYKVPKSDHYSIAKVESESAIQHRLLRQFVLESLETNTDSHAFQTADVKGLNAGPRRTAHALDGSPSHVAAGRLQTSLRMPIRDLDKKIQFLQRSPLAQELCRHNGPSNFAETTEIAWQTLRDAIRDKRMSEISQETLAAKCQFDLLWPEWNDIEGRNRDTADRFEAKYILEHTINLIRKPSPGSSTRDINGTKSGPHNRAKDPRSIDGPDRMALEEFVARLDLPNVKVIRIIATTGKVTVMHLLQSIQDAAKRRRDGVIDIQILLNAAFMSDAGRPAGLVLTQKLIQEFQTKNTGFTVSARSYASPAVFRGVIVEHVDGTFSGHLGYYFWGSSGELENKSRWNRNGIVILPSPGIDPTLEVCLSWFRHYWGTSIVNTIIFDFDDTIFATTDAQVAGWVGALERAASEKIIDVAHLHSKYAHLPDAGTRANSDMKTIFLEKQSESAIFATLFSIEPSAKAKQFIRSSRLEIREAQTESTGTPMHVVLSDVEKLYGHFRLVIASAASEELVHRVLLKHEIGLFSYVYGRNPTRTNQQWREVEMKSQLFVRLSSMLGVPLERMIFVGDSEADYRAAKQLGIPFIENAFNAQSCGVESLIKSPDGTHDVISGKVPGELIETVRRIEVRLLERWRKV